MNAFINSINGVLIDRNFYFPANNLILTKQLFIQFVEKGLLKNIEQRQLINHKMYLYNSNQNYFIFDIESFYLRFVCFFVNILFILSLLDFLSSPNFYLLFILFIKIISDLFIIYTYYNQMRLKFPKISSVIFTFIAPFYFIKDFIEKRFRY